MIIRKKKMGYGIQNVPTGSVLKVFFTSRKRATEYIRNLRKLTMSDYSIIEMHHNPKRTDGVIENSISYKVAQIAIWITVLIAFLLIAALNLSGCSESYPAFGVDDPNVIVTDRESGGIEVYNVEDGTTYTIGCNAQVPKAHEDMWDNLCDFCTIVDYYNCLEWIVDNSDDFNTDCVDYEEIECIVNED